MRAEMNENKASDVTLTSVKCAQQRISPHVRHTPLMRNATLSTLLGTNVYLKLELFQRTGAFKVRGAFNKILSRPHNDAHGVVAVSAGNHAQAVAYAARTCGLQATILMPANTPRNYIDATRGYGAEVVFAGDMKAAFAAVPRYEAEGYTYTHPYGGPDVIAGQGTIGLEIYQDLPGVTDVFVSIGGGRLAPAYQPPSKP